MALFEGNSPSSCKSCMTSCRRKSRVCLNEDFIEVESELRVVKGDSAIEDDTALSELPSEEFCRDSTLLRKFDEVNAKDSSGLKSGPKKILTPFEFVGVSNFWGV